MTALPCPSWPESGRQGALLFVAASGRVRAFDGAASAAAPGPGLPLPFAVRYLLSKTPRTCGHPLRSATEFHAALPRRRKKCTGGALGGGLPEVFLGRQDMMIGHILGWVIAGLI